MLSIFRHEAKEVDESLKAKDLGLVWGAFDVGKNYSNDLGVSHEPLVRIYSNLGAGEFVDVGIRSGLYVNGSEILHRLVRPTWMKDTDL